MKKTGLFALVFFTALTVAAAQAEMSPKDAVKAAKKNLGPLLTAMYLDPIEYDTALALPVHSRLMAKNDFYLVYFLAARKFQAEMAIDKKTGKAEILAVGQISPPYFASMNGDFNLKYFSIDSMTEDATRRTHLKPDSVRLIYLGITPLLGKRGTIWEIFTTEGISYISFGAVSIDPRQLYKDMNMSMRNLGNFVADSLKGADLLARIGRLSKLTPEQLKKFDLTPEKTQAAKTTLTAAKDSLYLHFPELRGKLEPPKPADSTKKN
jgi:hypothetical protein